MLHLLWLIPALPILGFLILALAGSRLSRHSQSLVGVGSVGGAAVSKFSHFYKLYRVSPS